MKCESNFPSKWMKNLRDRLVRGIHITKSIIGKVQCGFLVLIPYNAIFLLYAPAPAPIKIGFNAVRFGVVRCKCGLVVWAELIWVRLGQSKYQFESKKSTFTTTQKFS